MNTKSYAFTLFFSVLFCFSINTIAHPFFKLNGCANAGDDAYVCGFTYQLNPDPIPGTWTFLCDMSDGFVSFSGDPVQPDITVTNCGNYYFEYQAAAPGCSDADTVLVSFEDPGYSQADIFVDISLEYENVECHQGGQAPPCTNTITVPGLNEPTVNWAFCSEANCLSLIYDAEAFGVANCIANTIVVSSDVTSDNVDGGCSNFGQDPVLDDFWDIVGGLAGDVYNDLSCPLAEDCFTPQIIDTQHVTQTVMLPKREGGRWHCVKPGGLLPMDDQTFFSDNGKDFMITVEPSPFHYGPQDLNFRLFEITGFGDTIYSSVALDLDVQWVEEWSYVPVTKTDTIYIYEDDPYNCPGNSVTPPIINVPDIPPYPCGPITLSFPAFDCTLCQVSVVAVAIPPVAVLDCCNPCVGLSGTGSSTEPHVSVRWENGNPFMFVCNAGSYTLTVTSLPSGCSETEEAVVFEDFDTPDIAVVPPEIITCQNPCVTLETIVSGNPGQFTFNWLGPNGFSSNAQSPSVCEPGNYQVIVTNLWNCCETSESVNVSEFIDPEIIDIEAIVCEGECYDLNGESFCTAGNYSQNGFDANGCPTITNLTLENHQIPDGSVILTLCEEDNFIVNGTVYDLGNPAGTEVLQSAEGCDSLVNVQLDFFAPEDIFLQIEICPGECYELNGTEYCEEGIFSGTYSDSNGCEAFAQLEIIHFPEHISDEIYDLCESEFVEINGTVYDETNPSGTEIFTDQNGCDSVLNIQINTLQTEFQFLNETVCEGECFDLNGEMFCAPGVYVQNIPGTNGCDAVVELTLSNFTTQSSDLTVDLCQNENIDINGTIYDENNPSGTEVFPDQNGCDSLVNVQIQWIPAEWQLISETVCEGECFDLNGQIYCDPGVFIQSFPGSNGCEGFIELTLSNFTTQSSDLNPELCEGDFIQVNGTIYDENNPSGTEIFTDHNGCDSLVNVQITTIPSETIIADAAVCFGDCLDWFGQLVCDAGIYTHTETGSNGCEIFHELHLEVNQIFASNLTTTLCSGDQMILNGVVFDENNPSGSVLFTAQNGCDSLVNVDLFFENIEIQIQTPDKITCVNNSVLISAEIQTNAPNFSIQWVSPNGNIVSDPTLPEITVDVEGEYILIVQTPADCSEMQSVLVENDFEMPVLSLEPVWQLDCNSGEIVLTTEGDNFDFEWFGPGIDDTNRFLPNPTVSVSGDYSVVLTNPNNGCSESANATVEAAEEITFEVILNECCAEQSNGGIIISLVQGGTEPYQYFFNGNPAEPPFIGLPTGTYLIEIQDINGCSVSREVDVLETPKLEYSESTTIHICGNQEVTLEPEIITQGQILNYTWDDGTKNPFRIVNRPGLYNLTAESACETVELEFEIQDDDFSIRNKIYIPNAFSPNADGTNDVFRAFPGVDLTEYELMIFDRWGNLMFETDDPSKGWDGSLNNQKSDSAVFLYLIHAKGFGCDDRLQEVFLKGDFVLMR